MKYVVLVSHGTFAPGLHSAVQMMTGPREDVLDTSLLPDMSADTFQENFRKLVEPIKPEDEIILLADILSGFEGIVELNTGCRTVLFPPNADRLSDVDVTYE